MPRPRSPFAVVIADLKRVCAKARLKWYVFGAQAALLYGSARLTADVDATVRLGTVATTNFVRALEASGFQLRVVDPSFTALTRVLPMIHRASGIPADLVLASPGIEDAFVERARLADFGGVKAPVACPEDLVAMKILAGRPKDHEDIAAVLVAQGKDLDLALVRSTLRAFEGALDQSDLVPAFEKLLRDSGIARRRRK